VTRLALCGNVFRMDCAQEAIDVLRLGALPELHQRLQGASQPQTVGFGLYLSAQAAAELCADERLRADWQQALAQSPWPIWTANAFPYGGFHARKVKQAAFLPDWTSPQRLHYTEQVTRLLADVCAPGERASVSTCPLGYGPTALQSDATLHHLTAMQKHLVELENETGVHITLAFEPEPDGAFERVDDLARWLQQNLPQHHHLGICWDLCHSAVVNETAAEVLAALDRYEIPCGKVQISAALIAQQPFTPELAQLLADLALDPWFHQVRGQTSGGTPLSWPDLPDFLDARSDSPTNPGPSIRASDPEAPPEPTASTLDLEAPPEPTASASDQVRIHCHVPVHRREFLPGLSGTPWQVALQAALRAGIQDFELETYTLPVLPQSFLQEHGLVGTLFAEIQACFDLIGLDTAPGL
jgi:hypothetical protein